MPAPRSASCFPALGLQVACGLGPRLPGRLPRERLRKGFLLLSRSVVRGLAAQRGRGAPVAPSDPSPQQKDPGRTGGGRPSPPPRGSRPPRVCGQMQDTPTGPARGGLLRVRASRGCRNKLPPNRGLQTTHTSVLSRFCGPEVQTRLLGLKIEVLPAGSGERPSPAGSRLRGSPASLGSRLLPHSPKPLLLPARLQLPLVRGQG